MNVHVHKNEITSRRSQELNCQLRDVGIQRRDIPEAAIFNVATFQRRLFSTSRR